MDVNWQKLIDDIRKVVLSKSSPVLAGHLSPPGHDLDMVVILKKEHGTLRELAECLDSIRVTLAQSHASVILYRRFVTLPFLTARQNDSNKPALVHLMVYPDLFVAKRWEKQWILQSLLKSLTFWVGEDWARTDVLPHLRPEAFEDRFLWYRNILVDGIHENIMNQPDLETARRDLLNRLHHVAKYALYEVAVANGAEREDLRRRGALTHALKGVDDQGLLKLLSEITSPAVNHSGNWFVSAVEVADRALYLYAERYGNVAIR